MADREQNPPSSPLWRRFWRSPEPEISAAAASGELQVAVVRLLLLSVLLYLPLREYLPTLVQALTGGSWAANPMRDPRLVLGVAGGSLFAALMIYSTAQRNRGSAWIGFVSSALDVTLVSGMLLLLLFLGRPLEAMQNAVVFPVYFLAIAATSLRYDARICLVTGALALLQYGALVSEVARRWPPVTPFPWEEQIWRMLQLAGATTLAATVVTRSRELRLLSTRDRFTGLLNRTVFNEQLEREVETAREEEARLTVAMVDIDHFKRFNDTHGHAGGDIALRLVAQTLRQSCRSTDAVARYGGEEFGLILPGVRAGRAGDLLERVRRVVAATPIHLPGHPYPVSVTVSIGVASWPEDGNTALEILACADRRLYEAKARGRDRVIGPAPAQPRPLEEQLRIPGTDSSPGGEISLTPLVPPDT